MTSNKLSIKELENMIRSILDEDIYIAKLTFDKDGNQLYFDYDKVPSKQFILYFPDPSKCNILYFKTPTSFNRENEIISISMNSNNDDDIFVIQRFISLDMFSLAKFMKDAQFTIDDSKLMISIYDYKTCLFPNLENI